MRRILILRCCVLSAFVILYLVGCWNPFAPKIAKPGPGEELPDPTSPDKLFEILDYAMNHGDIEKYEEILDDNYWWTDPTLVDTLGTAWGKTEDVRIVGRIFENFVSFTFDYDRNQHWIEYGSNMNPPPGSSVSDEHPNENWEVFMGPVTYLLLDESGDGFFIQEDFEIKLRQIDYKGRKEWRIIRWIDHPRI